MIYKVIHNSEIEDWSQLQTILNQWAEKGWTLHSIVMSGQYNINATIIMFKIT